MLSSCLFVVVEFLAPLRLKGETASDINIKTILCHVQLSNKRLPQASAAFEAWKIYKRRGASSSKYGIYAVVSYPQWTPEAF